MEATTLATAVSKVTVSFSWYDYIIFSTMLALSSIIGIYFGCFGSKQSTASEYLMGSKKMHVIPIVMSLVASHISGITLLGVPADVYKIGGSYWLASISLQISSIVSIFVYLPVLHKSEVTSVYEYLEKRFDHKTRIFSSFLFALSQVLFLPLVIYIPALAFSAATGINLHLITPLICGVCIFYTTIGGLKAVVWTDTLQFTITLGAVATVLVLGVRATGGLGNVWNKSLEGHRLDFISDFEFDVTRSDNFWSAFIGMTIFWISMTNTNQGCVQKLLSVSSLRETKIATILFCFGMGIVKSASVFTGLIIYARYADCDPFSANQIKRKDQLLPYYVLDVAGHIPGLSGLFIAGVFSAGLSTLSAHLNCLSGTLYEDFVQKFVSTNITEKSKSNILKLLVVICGILSTLLVFVFERMGGIVPLAIGFGGVTGGPMLGLFTLGVLSRKANSKGAFWGGVIGLCFIISLAFPAKILQSQKRFFDLEKPISVAGCRFNFTEQYSFRNATESGGFLSIFQISFYYYTLLGCLVTMSFGLLISYFSKSEFVDENLLSPLVKKEKTDYSLVEKARHLILDNSEKCNSQ